MVCLVLKNQAFRASKEKKMTTKLPHVEWVLIGSCALRYHMEAIQKQQQQESKSSPIHIQPQDVDLLMTEDGFDALRQWSQTTSELVTAEWMYGANRFDCTVMENHPTGAEHPFDKSNRELMCLAKQYGTHIQVNQTISLYIASIELLEAILSSHIYHPKDFTKYISQLGRLRSYLRTTISPPMVWKRSSEMETFLIQRRKATDERLGMVPASHITMKDQTNETFLDSKKLVIQTFLPHDDIHERVKLGKTAMHHRIRKDLSKPMCDEGLFQALHPSEQLQCVQEEAMTIALERYLLTNDMELEQEQSAYEKALVRVCTTLTKGWFREFAVDHYQDLVKCPKSLAPMARSIWEESNKTKEKEETKQLQTNKYPSWFFVCNKSKIETTNLLDVLCKLHDDMIKSNTGYSFPKHDLDVHFSQSFRRVSTGDCTSNAYYNLYFKLVTRTNPSYSHIVRFRARIMEGASMLGPDHCKTSLYHLLHHPRRQDEGKRRRGQWKQGRVKRKDQVHHDFPWSLSSSSSSIDTFDSILLVCLVVACDWNQPPFKHVWESAAHYGKKRIRAACRNASQIRLNLLEQQHYDQFPPLAQLVLLNRGFVFERFR